MRVEKYKFTRAAAEDLEQARDWYDAHNPSIADRLIHDIKESVDQIRRRPGAGRAIELPIRRIEVRLFPFYVYYVHEDDIIKILRIVHKNRHPDEWRRAD